MRVHNQGPGNRGGRTPLESGIYIVKKILKFFSNLFGLPLDKNRSKAPEDINSISSFIRDQNDTFPLKHCYVKALVN